MFEIFQLTNEKIINLGKDVEKQSERSAYALAVFKNKLYLAATYHSRQQELQNWLKVQHYNHTTGIWKQLYRTPLQNSDRNPYTSILLEDYLWENSLDDEEIISQEFSTPLYSEVVVFKGRSDTAPTLYISAVFSHTGLLFRSVDGESFQIISDRIVVTDASDANIIGFRRLVPFQDRLYALPVGTIKGNESNRTEMPLICCSDDPASGKWQIVNFPGFDDSSNKAISQMAEFNNCLYVATLNPEHGCQIWKTRGINNNKNLYTWEKILGKGIYRYSLNQLVQSMVIFNQSLYLTTGVDAPSENNLKHEQEIPSPELICIYPDDSWDIVVGTPKFTPNGLKVPLSAMRPGFDKPFNSQFQCVTVHNENLYIGMQAPDGFQLLITANGENWQPISLDQFGDNLQAELKSSLSTLSGLIFVANIEKIADTSNTLIEASASNDNGNDMVAEAKNDSYSTVTGTVTNILSSTEHTITHRHQEHMWMTDDGALHAAINLGLSEETGSWKIFSSFDNGTTWPHTTTIENTENKSTCDCILFGNKLYIVYSCLAGTIVMAQFTYSKESLTWEIGQTSIVYEDSSCIGSVPSLTVDTQERIWCAFICRDKSNKRANIKVFYSHDRGMNWNDTEQVFGHLNILFAKSPRLVALSDKVGLIYTDEYMDSENNTVRTRNWAYRMNDWPLTEAWSSQLLFQHERREEVKEGPFGSHFSVVVDGLENIHVAVQDKGKLLYLRYDSTRQDWDEPKFLTGDYKISYVQTSVSKDDKIFIICNLFSFVAVLESSDYGKNFQLGKILLHPSDMNGDFTRPRIETPPFIHDKLTVLQQYKIDESWGLLAYEIPAATKVERQIAETSPQSVI